MIVPFGSTCVVQHAPRPRGRKRYETINGKTAFLAAIRLYKYVHASSSKRLAPLFPMPRFRFGICGRSETQAALAVAADRDAGNSKRKRLFGQALRRGLRGRGCRPSKFRSRRLANRDRVFCRPKSTIDEGGLRHRRAMSVGALTQRQRKNNAADDDDLLWCGRRL
jgi:hypothetical protein